MRVTVTGATGHLGANLVRALVARNFEVRALVFEPRAPALDGLDIEQVRGSVLDPDSLIRAFAGVEVVYHLAGIIDLNGAGEKMRLVNVTGTDNVLSAASASAVRRVVHFSSIHALARPVRGQVLDESHPLAHGKHTPPYDQSKADSERIALGYVERGLDVRIVSPTGVIGPYDFIPSKMGQTLADLATGKLPALIEGGFDWVDVRDVAEGAVQAAEHGRAGERYVLSGHTASLADLATLVEQLTGTRAPRLVVPSSIAAPFAAVIETVCAWTGRATSVSRYAIETLREPPVVSNRKAHEELRYHSRPLTETIRDTLDWLERTGRLRAAA